ncbi:hypothetical protein NEPAR06_0347 [Nematocida parisii]|nr:hypothetical protein NEPAR06_0347 [Nematocida parisii]
MQGAKNRNRSVEDHSEERSTDVEEDIRKLMNQKSESVDKKKSSISIDQVETTISLLKQLAIQYDGLEVFLNSYKSKESEELPTELLTELVKSSKISPTLCRMIESVTEEVKALQRENTLLKVSEKTVRERLDSNSGNQRSLKMEVKYLNQALADATKEIKRQKDDAAEGRKRILELEASLDAQKKIAKGLLRDKKVSNKETDIHEEEKQILQSIIKHKDEEVEKAKREKEEIFYEKQQLRREHEMMQIQYARLKQRADLKEKALYTCTAEMESLIKQMDKLSRSEMQKKERLEYLEINKKKKQHDSELAERQKTRRYEPITTPKVRAPSAKKHAVVKKPSVEKSLHPEVIPDESDTSEHSESVNESITDIPVSFSQAVDNASVSDVESVSSNKTTTSFKEMQRKTEEMSKKFRELENLLGEIKRSNDSELDKVEEKIDHKTRHA